MCDVAGRTGNVSLEIAQSVSHLEFVVQDQESIIKSLSIPVAFSPLSPRWSQASLWCFSDLRT